MRREKYSDNVFINCPFDAEYRCLFDAIVFTIVDCGFRARCALEEEDGSVIRAEKIFQLITNCKYGIHDISRTEIDPATTLPRFNMPLELGYFLAAKKYGTGKQKEKKCLILDKEKYRFQQFISDIAGQDIKHHNKNTKKIIGVVRNWLSTSSRRSTIPGGSVISGRYNMFRREKPRLCKALKLDQGNLTFFDYGNLVAAWLEENTH